MKYYSFHPDTKEIIGSNDAWPNPEEFGRFLIPANATTEEPPVAAENQIAVFDGEIWSLEHDFRDHIFYDQDGSLQEITAIGIQPHENWTTAPPEPSIEKLIALKIEALNTFYSERVTEGYTFEGQLFQIDDKSRLNMNVVMTDFALGTLNPHGSFWRSEDNQMIPMTDEKVKEFIYAVKAYWVSCYQILWGHKDAIQALSDANNIDAYDFSTGWPSNA